MICSSKAAEIPAADRVHTNAKYSIASQSNPSRYSDRNMNAESLIQVNR